MSSTVELDAPAAAVVFRVYGLPVAQGSKSAIRRGDRVVVVEGSRATLRPWRAAIAAEAAELLPLPLAGPVSLRLTFTLPRPKSHYRTGARAGELREAAPAYHSTRPDGDKLARAVLDALAGVAYLDDGQVARLEVRKLFGERPGVTVELEALA